MAGPSFQPPIHLDPSQDAAQQTSFINQNFLSLASTLETNSFRVVKGPLTMQVSSSGGLVNWTTVPHGLDFTPIVFGFINNANISLITTSGSLILPSWTEINIDIIKGTATNSGNAVPVVAFSTYAQIIVDDINVYGVLFNAKGVPVAPLTLTYYLFQLPSQS